MVGSFVLSLVSRTTLLAAVGLLFAGFLPTAANALSIEQARESCHEQVGRPTFQACMQGLKGGGGDREANRERCQAVSKPKFQACVQAALNKANGRANVAITIDNGGKKEVVDLGRALPTGFVPPPRTITDITAVLDKEKPDPKAVAEMKAQADAEPPQGGAGLTLAHFYYDRGNARLTLGRVGDALDDTQKALPLAQSDAQFTKRLLQFLGIVRQALGDPKSAMQAFQDLNRAAVAEHVVGWVVNSSWNIIGNAIAIGDIAWAEGALRQLTAAITEARTSGNPKMRKNYQLKGRSYEADFEAARALIFEAKGQFHDAELAYKRSADYKHASVADSATWDDAPPKDQLAHAADGNLLSAARMKAKQGRLAEAEVDARQVLLVRL